MSAVRHGGELALRALGARWAAATSAITLLLVAVIASLERQVATSGAADRTLQGAVFGLLLPLGIAALWSRATGARRTGNALRVLTRHGAQPLAAALGFCCTLVALAAVGGASLAAAAVLLSRTAGDPAMVSDTLTSAWVGALGGASYAAWLGVGSGLGRGGAGRLALLGLDWLLGASPAALAIGLPRAHLQNLLGGSAATWPTQQSSSTTLAVTCALLTALATWRAARPGAGIDA